MKDRACAAQRRGQGSWGWPRWRSTSVDARQKDDGRCVSEEEFGECVSNRNPPAPGFGSDQAPAAALPAQLVDQLITTLESQKVRKSA
jgi:hypothetical protein